MQQPRELRLPPAFDFVAVEALVQLGWRMSVQSLQLLVALACALALPVAVVVAVVVAALTRAGLQDGAAPLAERAWIAVVALALLNAYLAAVHGFRETFSKRRFAVGASPNAGLLRAVDVSALSMFVAACAIRTVVVFSLATLATAASVVVFVDVLPAPIAAALVLLPVAACLALLAVGARNAIHGTPRHPRLRARHVVPALAAVAASGLAVATMIAAAGGDAAGDAGASTLVIGPGPALAVLAALLVLTAAAAGALRRAVGELRRHSFELEIEPPAPTPPAPAAAPRRLAGVLHRELCSGRAAFLLQRTALGLAGAVALLAGMRLGGQDVVPLDGGHELGLRVTLLATFVMALTATELVLNVCGPVTLRRQLRYAWDCGAPVPRMLPPAVAYWLAPSVLIGAAAALVLWLALGDATLAPPALGAATAAAALCAGALSATPRSHADGTGDTSLFVAFVTVLLAVPALAAFMTGGRVLAALGLLYALLLIGGATRWTARRVTRLPCASTT